MRERPRRFTTAAPSSAGMQRGMTTYHPDLPPGCPPNEAAHMTGTIYRRVTKPPAQITNSDFLSSREKGDAAQDRACQRWGTSVWIDLDHLKHDMNAIAYLRKYRFVSVDILPQHGVIKKTHSNNFPQHRTFWRDYLTDFGAICHIIYSPQIEK